MITKLFLAIYALATILPGNTIRKSQPSEPIAGPPEIGITIPQAQEPPELLKPLDVKEIKPLETVTEQPQAVLNSDGSVGSIQASIVKWAAYYGVSGQLLLRIANCESSFNQNIVNYSYSAGGGSPSGVFQFLPSTFARYASAAGIVNPNIFNYEHNVQAAAYAFSHGGASEWECK